MSNNKKVDLPDMSDPNVARAFYAALDQGNADTLNMRKKAADKKAAPKKASAKKK